MKGLSDLTFTDAPRRSVPSVDMAVDKFVKAVVHQLAAFKAFQNGEEYTVQRIRYTGKGADRVKTPVTIALRKWWSETEDGQCYIALRYGNRPLEIADGKHCILVPSIKNVKEALEVVLLAAKSGELNDQILAARRKGGKKKKS